MKNLPVRSFALESQTANTQSGQPMEGRAHGIAQHLGHEPIGLDELQRRSGLSTSHLQAELFQMEMAGNLGRLPGGLYQQLSRPGSR
jgi:DNA processing protein